MYIYVYMYNIYFVYLLIRLKVEAYKPAAVKLSSSQASLELLQQWQPSPAQPGKRSHMRSSRSLAKPTSRSLLPTNTLMKIL